MFSRSVLRVVNKTPASEATFVVKATVKEAVDTSARSFPAPNLVQEAFMKQFAGFRSRLAAAKDTPQSLKAEAVKDIEAELTTIKRRDELSFTKATAPKEVKLDSFS